LWDSETGAKIQTFTGHAEGVDSVAFNDMGTQLLTGSNDSTARTWDIKSGAEIQKFTGHAGSTIRRVAFHPDGKHALSAGRDNYVRMWNLETGNQVKKYKSSGKWADSLAITRDGKYLAIAGTSESGREVYVYDIASGDRLIECTGHTEGLTHVSFSPDGKRILSSSYDGTVRLWSRETGQELYRFPAWGEFLWSAEFSPDGQSFLSGGGGGWRDGSWSKGTDHAVRLWKVPDEKAIEEFSAENH
jgi:WD40 repeat protein